MVLMSPVPLCLLCLEHLKWGVCWWWNLRISLNLRLKGQNVAFWVKFYKTRNDNSVIYSLKLDSLKGRGQNVSHIVADGSDSVLHVLFMTNTQIWRLVINITAERRSVKAEPWLPSAVVFDFPSLNAHVRASSYCDGGVVFLLWLCMSADLAVRCVAAVWMWWQKVMSPLMQFNV